MRFLIPLFLALLPLTAGEFYYFNNGKKVPLKPLDGTLSARSVDAPMRFEDPEGRTISIANRLIVKFRSTENLNEYLNRYNLRIVKKYAFEGMYLLQAPTPVDAIEAANALYEMPDVEFAQPDIARKRMLR